MSDRADMLVHYFGYLVSDYDFRVEEKRYDPQVMGNAVVRFASPKLGVEIVVDRNQVLMSLGDPADVRKEWFEFSNVLRYFAPSVENAYIFPEKTAENTWDEIIQAQASRLADILRQYCDQLLKGDLSMKVSIAKIQAARRLELLDKLRRASPKRI